MLCAKKIVRWHRRWDFAVANDVNEALEMAIKEKGKDAHIFNYSGWGFRYGKKIRKLIVKHVCLM